ncbi:ead/Ea22-like family protein [Enterobacter hormaechei]|uniref:ead/Ea22-like family protein n=1 Tax=Enterobacter hormaechei TaxID=158836 RepID=UPI0015EB605C|nr:ead/Ea22-like family protein [Enterobacter hormaechei]HEO8919789.1 ead/Ea22-like family protein [Enterobacter hormaechei subsp. steigerwaltii]MBA2805375.1 ead/Ea22-like family protein [Enterobacter hormaechei]MCC2884085.1 ead/Ea22-like family protein [Enterobacter hormaechei]MCC2886964.1 ead/Ea22-like family protein [Enterobacter hormaechei]QMI67705.1 ead/Ea22-like family protein [Enterobacter hormaechei]
MSNIDKRALREAANAANAASWGNWESYKPHKGARGYEVKVGVKAVAQHCLKVDSVFIAAANPATMLALLDELEAKNKRIAELEAREVKLPKPISVLHRRDFMDSHRSIYAYPEAEVNAALADAGINVAAAGKGE